jgi:hypothetical protein
MISMKTMYCKTIGLVLFSFLLYNADAQVFTNDAGTREKHFIYEVKQIDEFFERFNNDTGSFIRKAYKAYHIRYSIDRPKLIKSLFNYETKSWDQAVIDDFVKDVTTPAQYAGKLNFLEEGWFAEARCKFQYNGSVIDIPIILRISTDSEKRSRWMVAAVKPNALKAVATAPPTAKENGNKLKFINPASHANNFIALGKAFDDKENLADYFEASFFNRHNALAFYNAVLNGQAKFLYVKDITYHFLQVDKWIFTVEHFQRGTLNAGWLINGLKKASEADKKAYLENLLEEQ